jgi:hypothetical protein
MSVTFCWWKQVTRPVKKQAVGEVDPTSSWEDLHNTVAGHALALPYTGAPQLSSCFSNVDPDLKRLLTQTDKYRSVHYSTAVKAKLQTKMSATGRLFRWKMACLYIRKEYINLLDELDLYLQLRCIKGYLIGKISCRSKCTIWYNFKEMFCFEWIHNCTNLWNNVASVQVHIAWRSNQGHQHIHQFKYFLFLYGKNIQTPLS